LHATRYPAIPAPCSLSCALRTSAATPCPSGSPSRSTCRRSISRGTRRRTISATDVATMAVPLSAVHASRAAATARCSWSSTRSPIAAAASPAAVPLSAAAGNLTTTATSPRSGTAARTAAPAHATLADCRRRIVVVTRASARSSGPLSVTAAATSCSHGAGPSIVSANPISPAAMSCSGPSPASDSIRSSWAIKFAGSRHRRYRITRSAASPQAASTSAAPTTAPTTVRVSALRAAGATSQLEPVVPAAAQSHTYLPLCATVGTGTPVPHPRPLGPLDWSHAPPGCSTSNVHGAPSTLTSLNPSVANISIE
jgi:hypothetical protein